MRVGSDRTGLQSAWPLPEPGRHVEDGAVKSGDVGGAREGKHPVELFAQDRECALCADLSCG